MAKILIVEDDNHLREIYELRMQAAGHEVVSAPDGEAALKVAIKEKPDLVISDVMMPKISGFDMLDILRSTEETKNAKIIMMTALSQAEDKQRAESLGADRYLVKSQVTLDDVAQVTEEVLSGKPAPDATPSESIDSASADQTLPPPAESSPSPVEQATTGTPVAVTTPVSPAPAAQPQADDSTQQPTTTDEPTTVTPMTTQAQAQAQPTASPTTQSTPQDDTTAADPNAIESEESAIAKQIEDFMHTKQNAEQANSTEAEGTATTNPAQPAPAESSEQPATNADTAQESPSTATTNPEQSPETPQNQQPPQGDQQPPSVASDEAPSKKKKVIQPINDLTASKSDELQSLLKKEVVREEMSKIVTDIQTKDVSDLSNDNAAEEALKKAQSQSSTQAKPTEQQTDDSQDIQVTDDGKIVTEDPKEVAAAQALKAAQSSGNQSTQNLPSSTPQPVADNTVQDDTPPPPPQPQPQPVEPKPQTAQPVETPVNTTQSAPVTQTQQQAPVIPHTNGTAIDGVVPASTAQQTTRQPQQAAPATPQATAPQPTTVQPQPQQEAAPENNNEDSTSAANPNDIAL